MSSNRTVHQQRGSSTPELSTVEALTQRGHHRDDRPAVVICTHTKEVACRLSGQGWSSL